MDNMKIGNLIIQCRKEKNLTQKELADLLHVSDKTISKWERGLGCPDIDSIKNLADVFSVNVTEILSGDIILNGNDSGNIKKTKFYVCPQCGNVVTSTNPLIINCCGKKLLELPIENTIESVFKLKLEYIEDEIYVSIDHEMKKQNYISFIAYLTSDKMMMKKLYPEQNAEARFKISGHGILYIYCKQYGLLQKNI
ncbi:helix-turn-helix domain-containing protein [Anaerosacchariphilus polymeriproducens]|uniref:Helix-turn-helix domain-containing protein n=1 Tax=Anaerosacchariphilus polymeriproducens TaxID=1812858 RepID=A0A371ATW5_9FIRM|nr:helix-turn-helix domain-containing protein [Anaerosacchariphilus polymeriproducens]RDU22940.1 helix-turn-helix domain-containing protein [Anaerosacchariphilus polymeriproducens]